MGAAQFQKNREAILNAIAEEDTKKHADVASHDYMTYRTALDPAILQFGPGGSQDRWMEVQRPAYAGEGALKQAQAADTKLGTENTRSMFPVRLNQESMIAEAMRNALDAKKKAIVGLGPATPSESSLSTTASRPPVYKAFGDTDELNFWNRVFGTNQPLM